MNISEKGKYLLRGIAYLASGLFLAVSGIFSWSGLNYIWGSKHGLVQSSGSIKLSIIMIGFALLIASYLEFRNARITQDRNSDES